MLVLDMGSLGGDTDAGAAATGEQVQGSMREGHVDSRPGPTAHLIQPHLAEEGTRLCQLQGQPQATWPCRGKAMFRPSLSKLSDEPRCLTGWGKAEG